MEGEVALSRAHIRTCYRERKRERERVGERERE